MHNYAKSSLFLQKIYSLDEIEPEMKSIKIVDNFGNSVNRNYMWYDNIQVMKRIYRWNDGQNYYFNKIIDISRVFRKYKWQNSLKFNQKNHLIDYLIKRSKQSNNNMLVLLEMAKGIKKFQLSQILQVHPMHCNPCRHNCFS